MTRLVISGEGVARRTMDIEVLRFIRSTLLLESMAARLHRPVDFVRQHQNFKNYRAEQARRSVVDSMLDQMDGKNNEQNHPARPYRARGRGIVIPRIAHAGNALGQLQRADEQVVVCGV